MRESAPAQHRRRLLRLVCATLTMLAAGVPVVARAAFPGANGRIAFYYEGTESLFTVNPDGSDFGELQSGVGRWLGPTWAKDGQRLAVGIYDAQAGTQDIWILQSDGTGLEQVTTSGRAGSPSWSPDGTEIAFSCLFEGKEPPPGEDGQEICVVTLATKQVRTITSPFDGVLGYEPAWSPKGDVIVYSGGHVVQVKGEEEPHVDLFSVDPAGGPSTNLTPDAIQEDRPDFSPDGEKIVVTLYATNIEEPGGIGIVDAGGGPGTLITDVRGDSYPAWSPDGTKIAFTRQIEGVQQIMMIDATGGTPVPITEAPYNCLHPDWGSTQVTRKVKLVFEPNVATIPGLEQFEVPATGFGESTVIATLTDEDDKPLADEQLVFLPDPTGLPPMLLCRPEGGRIWPESRLDDGTPVPGNFTQTTGGDGKVRIRVRAGTIPGSWELVARTPDSTGGDDLDQTSLTAVGTPGADVPDDLLQQLRIPFFDTNGARISTAGDPTLIEADVQDAVLEWLTLLKHQGRLPAVDFAPIHLGGSGGVVFYPRGADPKPLFQHFTSNGAAHVPYEARVFNLGIAQLLSGGQDLPLDLPTLTEWEGNGAASAGRLRPQVDETLQFFGYPYSPPLGDPATIAQRAAVDTQCGTPNPNLIGATVESPVNLLFADGQGRRFGVDADGTQILERAGGVLSYNADGEPAGYVLPAGDYTVTLSGTGKGKALITFLTAGTNASELAVFELKVKDGATGSLQVAAGEPAGTLEFGGKTYPAQPYGFTKSAKRCAAGKKKCVAKKVGSLLKCYAKGAKRGSLDQGCLGKARAKFESGAKSCFAKLEAKGGCLTTGDAAVLQAKTDGDTAGIVAALDPATPDTTKSACIAGKFKCVGKYAKALFGCHQAAEKAGAFDAGCAAGARAAFDGGANPGGGCFAKLESKGGCITTGDAGVLEAALRAAVNGEVCALDPVRRLAPCE